MTMADYRRALEAALHEHDALSKRRADIEGRLAQLAQTIGALSRLMGLAAPIDLGLTDACRAVGRTADTPLTAVQVRDRLKATGFDFSRHVNPLASIHTVLKRLHESGEMRLASGKREAAAYVWRRPTRVVGIRGGADAHAIADAWLAASVPENSDELT